MDLFDTCNICSKTIGKLENVVLTMDGHRQDDAFVDQYAEYSVENSAPYRGVYCMSCWDEVCGASYKIQDKKIKEEQDAAKK